MYKNLNDFIERLREAGELAVVATPVSAELEIAEITDRISKSPWGGKALLFTDTGTGFPVLTNMFGSEKRMALALGADGLDGIAERIREFASVVLSPKESFSSRLRMLPLLGEMSRWMPRRSSSRGECQQVIYKGADADLSRLPVLKCWPHDGGPFVTLPMVHTTDPQTGVRNVGMYRMQVTGPRTTGIHWHLHKTGERHYRKYKEAGIPRMPVSVALGGDPAYTYSATAPLPDGIDEYLLAGFLRGRRVKLVKCVTNDIYVPSDCDIVIEGYVDTTEEKFVEGPFGDHTGFYSLEDLYPVFHVTAITHRRDAVYPATIVGVPPQEDYYIARATERIFLEPIRLAIQPEVTDMYMPGAGVAHNLAIVSIDKSYPGQPFKCASSLWGAGQMMFNKIVLITGSDDGVRDIDILSRKLRDADLSSDLLISRGVLDVLDHATATPGEGGKLALDLTVEREQRSVVIPDRLSLPSWCGWIDTSLAHQWGAVILFCSPDAGVDMDTFIESSGIEGVNYYVIADSAAGGMDKEMLLWFVCGNTEMSRDVRLCGGSLVIDGRTKTAGGAGMPRRWPAVVVSGGETVNLVDEKWKAYGLGEFIPSTSRLLAPLIYFDGARAEPVSD